jgi:protein Tex
MQTTSSVGAFDSNNSGEVSNVSLSGAGVNFFELKCAGVPLSGIRTVLSLHLAGSTVPFIARYRKEATGNLDEVAIIRVIEVWDAWQELEKRRAFVTKEIAEQGKLTDELALLLAGATELSVIEDLYLPYKKKKKTKATIAIEAGLLPLADWIWESVQIGGISDVRSPQERAEEFINTDAGIADTKAALDGAGHIITERIAEIAELRQRARDAFLASGHVCARKTEKAKSPSKYELYFQHSETVSGLLEAKNSHRYLAMKRGWNEEELALSFTGAGGDDSLEKELLSAFESFACPNRNGVGVSVVQKSARVACKAYVWPSIENEVHSMLRQVADDAAIGVFADNVRTVLLEAPFGSKTVLGVDPGLRTGCKIALIDQSGAFVADTVIKLLTDADKAQAKLVLQRLTQKVSLEAVAVGNGTAGRETERFVRDTLKELGHGAIPVIMVSEAGASVYSASEIARNEFPQLDLTVRGAISIARRLQDPLSELVKVDPKSIGVGQYQHDVSQSELKKSLQRVVESCVNSVGVNLNTASEYLLSFVSGIGPSLAKAIVQFRQEKGLFNSRQQLLSVPRFGGKAYEQAAGFLRIPGGENPLDNTGVHPERYELLTNWATKHSKKVTDLAGAGASALKGDAQLEKEIGAFTLSDIVAELQKPGRDPREGFQQVEFLDGVYEVKDLQLGMICPGVITNVTNFGAFIDIGVHQDGFVHISRLSESFVKDPKDVVSPGLKVRAKVLGIDLVKNQIALSLRMSDTPEAYQNERSGQRGGDGSLRGGGRDKPRGGSANDRSHNNRSNSHQSGNSSSNRGAEAPLTNNPFAALAQLRK